MLTVRKHCTTVVEVDVSAVGVDVDGEDVTWLAQVRDATGTLVLSGVVDAEAQAADDIVEFVFAHDAEDLVAAELGDNLAFGVMCTTDDLGPFMVIEDDARIAMPAAFPEPEPAP